MARETDLSMADTAIAALLAQGESALQDDRYDDAQTAFRAVLARAPDNADALRRLGAIAFRDGRHDDAFGLLELSVGLAPDNADAHNNLAAILQSRGETDQAEVHFRRALELTPDHGDIHFNLGLILLGRGNRAAARLCFEAAVRLLPDDADAYYNLGLASHGDAEAALAAQQAAIARNPKHAGALLGYAILLREHGRLDEALAASTAALAQNRGDGPAAFNHGAVLYAHGKRQEAVAHFQRAIAAGYDGPEVQNYLGRALVAAGQLAAASRAFRRGLEQAPEDFELNYNMHESHARAIPTWPFQLLDNRARNNAYREAIERAVTPGDTVLVIGAGAGLTAMMAARAGAGKVIACEPLAPLAALARRIIARNGYEDRITVIAKPAMHMRVVEDLPGPVDLIVAENVDEVLIGDNLLPALRYAVRHLARPGARVIPALATVWGMLVEWPESRVDIPSGDLQGFDFRDIELFRNPLAPVSFDWERETHRPMSQPFAIAEYDFLALAEPPPRRHHDVEGLHSVAAHAVVIWFDLHFDDQVEISTRAALDFSRWHSMAYRLEGALPVRRGDFVRIAVEASDDRFYITATGQDGAGR